MWYSQQTCVELEDEKQKDSSAVSETWLEDVSLSRLDLNVELEKVAL